MPVALRAPGAPPPLRAYHRTAGGRTRPGAESAAGAVGPGRWEFARMARARLRPVCALVSVLVWLRSEVGGAFGWRCSGLLRDPYPRFTRCASPPRKPGGGTAPPFAGSAASGVARHDPHPAEPVPRTAVRRRPGPVRGEGPRSRGGCGAGARSRPYGRQARPDRRDAARLGASSSPRGVPAPPARPGAGCRPRTPGVRVSPLSPPYAATRGAAAVRRRPATADDRVPPRAPSGAAARPRPLPNWRSTR